MKALRILLSVLLLLVCVAAPSLALGQQYIPLENIPGLKPSGTGGEYIFPDFLNALFRILVAAGAILAVLMLVIGGIQYMSAEALGSKDEARSRMWNAVLGLLLLILSWLILYTINPNLVNFQLLVPSSSALRQGTGTGQIPNNPGSGPGARSDTNCSVHPTLGRICEGGTYTDIDGTRYVISNGTPVKESDYFNDAAGFDQKFLKAILGATFKTGTFPVNDAALNAALTDRAKQESVVLASNAGNKEYMEARRNCIAGGFLFASFDEESWTCADYNQKKVDLKTNPRGVSELDASALFSRQAKPEACLMDVRRLCWFYQAVEANAVGGRTASFTYVEAPDGSCSCLSSFK